MAYNTLQAYVSSLLPGNLGFQSLCVVYIFYVVCLVGAPFVCEVLGDIGAMVLGSVCYIAYIGSLVTINNVYLILAASALLGFGAAILWVAQGSALTRWSTDATRGKYAGIFWAVFQVSSVIGPLTSYVVLSDVSSGDKVIALFATFAAVALVAVGIFCLHWCKCMRIVFPSDSADRAAAAAAADIAAMDGSDADSTATTAYGDETGTLDIGGGGGGDNGRVEEKRTKQQPQQVVLVSKHKPRHQPDRESLWTRLCRPVVRGVQLCRTANVALLLMACAFTGVETSFSNGEFFKLVGLLPCDGFSGNQTQ